MDERGKPLPEPPYEPEGNVCHGCKTTAAYDRAVRKGAGGDMPDGFRIRLKPFDPTLDLDD